MLTLAVPILIVVAASWIAASIAGVWHAIPRTNADFDLAGLRFRIRGVPGPVPAGPAANPAAAFYGNAIGPRLAGAILRGIDRIAPDIGTRGALMLFCTPIPWKLAMRGIVPSRWRTETFAFESGPLVAYRRRAIGTGKPKVLLVHGWAGSGAQLFRLGDALADAGYDPVVLDFPAHGRSAGWQSTLPQFQRAIYAVASRVGPLYAVVAHSLGAIATTHAAARGLSVERLVLIAPSAPPMVFLRWFAGAFGLRDAVADRMRDRIESRESVSVSEFDPEWLGPRIRQRVLLVHDGSDRVAPVAVSQRLLRRLSDARLVTTNGLGHRRVLEDRGVANEVVAHLAAG